MRLFSARSARRVRRRHAAHVYRFVLALLGDPCEAKAVTRRVLARADLEHVEGRWALIRIAHEACRAHGGEGAPEAGDQAGPDADAESWGPAVRRQRRAFRALADAPVPDPFAPTRRRKVLPPAASERVDVPSS